MVDDGAPDLFRRRPHDGGTRTLQTPVGLIEQTFKSRVVVTGGYFREGAKLGGTQF
jgi:hypothetical protein